MTRTFASCQCRGFRVVVEAEPDTVSVCHCQICQRRTGVPLTCNAYFPKSKVRLEGEHRIYTRECPEGRKLHNYFCPTCGSTVGWTLDLRPIQFGVAVGCFNDRNFPPPMASIWEEEMCAWAMLPADIQHFPRARPVSPPCAKPILPETLLLLVRYDLYNKPPSRSTMRSVLEKCANSYGVRRPEYLSVLSSRHGSGNDKANLDQTEKHLDTSDKLVQDQKALIALLGERGRDTARSKTTLAHLEEMRRLHVADRDRLLQALIIREFEE